MIDKKTVNQEFNNYLENHKLPWAWDESPHQTQMYLFSMYVRLPAHVAQCIEKNLYL